MDLNQKKDLKKLHLVLYSFKINVGSKGKFFSLNLNAYRNTHYILLNQAKVNFNLINKKLVKDLPPLNKVKIVYTVFFKTKTRRDIANILCIVDKFFCDLLVQNKVLKDDDFLHIPEITFKFGGIDKNQRIEITLEEIE